MNRLTQHTENGASLILDNPKNDSEAKQMLMTQFKEACNKLAAYEDAGLSPEEIVKLRKEITEQCTWIPVTERLPEDGVDVLIYFDKCGGDISMGWWSKDHWTKNGFMLCYNVTHWMPLPKPPEEPQK